MAKIEFIPKFRHLAEAFPHPVPVTSMLPDWWKKQTTFFNNDQKPHNGLINVTVKKCQAIFDSMTAGYYLLCPMDIYVDATKTKLDIQLPKEYMSRYHQIISTHSKEQLQEYPAPDGYHADLFRIHPHWLVKTDKGYSSLFMQPMHLKTDITAVPGFIDTDQYISDGYLSFFVPKGFVGTIKQGTPIVQVIPMRRDEWTSSINEDPNSDRLLEKQNSVVRSTFQNGYRMKFWSKKSYK